MSPVTAPSLADIPAKSTSSPKTFDRTRVFEIAISALIGAAFFLLLRATPDIPSGTDGYRHATQAWRLIHEPKAMFADPWHLAYFWPRPVDPWFGFHLMLAPLTLLFERITAIKLFTSAIFGSVAYVLFLLLRHLQANLRVFWVLLALTGSSMTLSRATSARPFLLSVLLTLLAALFTVEDKPVKLVLVSLIHALSYSIFFLVAMAPACWLLLRRDRRSGIAALCCGGGIGLGLLANPYFPENVRFDIVQASVVSIAQRAHVQIASELSSATWWTIASCLPAALPWVAALVVHLRNRGRTTAAPVMNLLLLLSAITFLGTVQVVRTADFFIPFAVLFAAATLSPYLKASRADVAIVGLLLALPCAANVYLTHGFELASPSLARFRGAAEYLKENAPQALVVNTEWAPDYFLLFFFNSQSRYTIGIDPTFTYLTDARKYWFWRHIFKDEPGSCDHEICAETERTDIVRAVREELRAQYVVTDHQRNPNLESTFGKNSSVTEVYRDAALSVFRIN